MAGLGVRGLDFCLKRCPKSLWRWASGASTRPDAPIAAMLSWKAFVEADRSDLEHDIRCFCSAKTFSLSEIAGLFQARLLALWTRNLCGYCVPLQEPRGKGIFATVFRPPVFCR